MFKAIISQQIQSSDDKESSPVSYNPYLPTYSVTSTLAQIGVDPGYFSDSECSSNSSDKNGDNKNHDSKSKYTKSPSPLAAPSTPQYNCFNDYFGINDIVKPSPAEGSNMELWCYSWNERQSPIKDRYSSGDSHCISPISEPSVHPYNMSPFPGMMMKKPYSNKKNKNQVCVFCRNNGEDEAVYSTHSLKDNEGKVTCPILFAYECPICKASGQEAHTLKYCPRNPNGQAAQLQQKYNTEQINTAIGNNFLNSVLGNPFQIMAQNYGHLSSELNMKLASLLQQQHQHKQQQQQQYEQQQQQPVHWYNNAPGSPYSHKYSSSNLNDSDNNLSQLFGKVSLDNFFQNYNSNR